MSTADRLTAALQLTRIPWAFVQTLFILLGFLAAGGSDHIRLLAAVVVLGPPLIYGGLYTINDMVDASSDRMHPKKVVRPLASGSVSMGFALALAVALLCVGFVLAAFIGKNFFVVCVLVLSNNFFYSLWPRLKDRVYLGVVSCSLNYPLRFLAGASLGHVGGSVLLLSALCFFVALDGFAAYRIYDVKTGDDELKIKFLGHEPKFVLLVRASSVIAVTSVLYLGLIETPFYVLLLSAYMLFFSEVNLRLVRGGVDFFKLLRLTRTLRLHRNLLYYPLMVYALILMLLYFMLHI